jgi:hypothetical protein
MIKVNDDWLGYPHYSSHILNFSTTKFQLDLRFNHPQDLTTMFHEIDVAQLQIAATIEEEEEEDPSLTCGGCGRRRGESGVVSNSHYISNDNNNMGIPTTSVVTIRRVKVGAGTRVEAGAT